jgi:hypothetical protein
MAGTSGNGYFLVKALASKTQDYVGLILFIPIHWREISAPNTDCPN